ncbi:PREDICTED: uncharacterized protein LOC105359072 [Ceratosolen solmsi marchali]|uniref:Uncharacterized protein LOC105359072 n=1 Tax=Ceratosolen solmsi marchali TaxID=326594 RepID=A0AAJ6VII6_9HYME|nr:PREDICTED: uncharacterized protein LOC105359072 [Ceratosolen solmsi marchali]
MEFLLDKENLHFVQPPENELQKVGERVPSEHELRVQRSLQRLNVPEWYKNSSAVRDGGGFRLKRHSDASQHGGWRALGSKTTSLSSLSSSSNRQPTPELAESNRTSCPAGTLLSPSPTPPVFSRWSTSLLNSAGSSPASSARSSFNHRQPYLGWRSQERLANPRTPAERLAQGILPQLQNSSKQQQQQQHQQLVSGEASEEGGSTSGACPEDLGSGFTSLSDGPGSLFLDLAQAHRQPELVEHQERFESPSPTQQQQHHRSRNRHRSEGEQHHHRHQHHHRQHQQQHQHQRATGQRRRSEGSPQRGPRGHRRVSLGGPEPGDERPVRCRNGKCPNSASPAEARRSYKSCHNCSSLYCSRECRRAHWQRHRKTCLYSRASGLCVQVLSSVKRDPASLGHVSALARRGFASQGRGAVRCFFASPELAESFVAGGLQELGEPAYVRWSDILPSEMGAELYAEAVRLCESYNPETRLVVYVSVCVVREVPSAGGGPVMWERQPVSRCAKLKLEGSRRTAGQTLLPPLPPPPPLPLLPPPLQSPSQSKSQQVKGSFERESEPEAEGARTEPRSDEDGPRISREMESPETLVLTSSPPEVGLTSPRHHRVIGFENIQRELRHRGVSLRRHFPQVYGKLCAYVDGGVERFAPVTIYPRDQASGRSFMCIIMLDAEPERLRLLPTDSSRLRTVDVGLEVPAE